MSAFLMLSLSACSREEPAAPQKKWTFRFSTDAVAVKGAPEYELSKSVGMSAFVFDKDAQPGLPEYMWNGEVAFSSGSVTSFKHVRDSVPIM